MHRPDLRAFWAELSPCEHFVQIYDTDDAFVDALADFIGQGLIEGQAGVVIATAPHRDALDGRLQAMGIDVAMAKSQDQFLSLDAEATLAAFMRDGWPDDQLFRSVVRQ